MQFNSLYYIPHLTIYNSQLYGGPDGELGAAMRYLSQRYSNTNRKVAGVLTDIGIYVSVETIVSTPVK